MTQSHVERARAYIALFNDPDAEPAHIEAFLAPEVVYTEMPNRIAPAGSIRTRQQMLEGVIQGRHILSEQHYTIVNAVDGGDTVVLEVEWTGTLKAAFGEMTPGTELRAQIAMVLEFADGQIVRQRNYDAYDPF